MATPAFPPDLVVDVHDLAAIILDCHAQLENKFAQTQLVELNRGTTPFQTVANDTLQPEWAWSLSPSQRRVAYILQRQNAVDPDTRVTIDAFAHPDGVKTPDGKALSRKELEDVFWRCKTFDSGYVLAYVAQQVFDALPPTTTLRARTSQGHTVTCKAADVTVAEVEIRPREACWISNIGVAHHFTGFDASVPWVWLFLGAPTSPDPEKDTRVVLDLAVAQLGARGLGGELFALERGMHYYDSILDRHAEQLTEIVLSQKLMLSPPDVRAHGEAVKARVLRRLAEVVRDAYFCRYCGKEGVELQCSRCKVAQFCRECQGHGWKYHKKWCKPTGA